MLVVVAVVVVDLIVVAVMIGVVVILDHMVPRSLAVLVVQLFIAVALILFISFNLPDVSDLRVATVVHIISICFLCHHNDFAERVCC